MSNDGSVYMQTSFMIQIRTLPHSPVLRDNARYARVCALQSSHALLCRSQRRRQYLWGGRRAMDHQGRRWRVREALLHTTVLAIL